LFWAVLPSRTAGRIRFERAHRKGLKLANDMAAQCTWNNCWFYTKISKERASKGIFFYSSVNLIVHFPFLGGGQMRQD
jgi:hypothetical protein